MYFATNVKINTWAVRLACFDIGAGAVDLVMATFTFTFTSAQLLQLPRPARFAVGSILSLQTQSDSLQAYFQLGGAFIFMFRITLAFRRPNRTNPNMYLTIIGLSYYCQVHVRIHIQIHFHYHVQIQNISQNHIQIHVQVHIQIHVKIHIIFKFMLRFIFKFMCQTHTQAFLVPQSLQIQGGLLDDTQSDSVPMFNLNCLDLNILAAHLACLQTESLLMGWHWFQHVIIDIFCHISDGSLQMQ